MSARFRPHNVTNPLETNPQMGINNLKPHVINFSSHVLTEAQTTLLNKGLKFCPVPEKPDLLELEVNMKEWLHKLEIKLFMSNTGSNESEYLLSRPGQFIPPENNEKNFVAVNNKIISKSETLEKLPKPTPRNNLNFYEKQALKELKNNANIVFRPFDKGSGICIFDKNVYINKISNILDNTLYEKLENNPDFEVIKQYHHFIQKYSQCFDSKGKEIDYLINFDFETANFYGNPKIHKCLHVQNIINTTNSTCAQVDIATVHDLKFRCITAGKHSPLSKLSELLDILLKPFVSKIQSHIRDAIDFKNKLRHVDHTEIQDIIIVTADVTDMYNNLKLPLGIRSVNYWLNLFPELLHHRFSEEFVIEALTLVLSNANFQFNGKFYHLKNGTVTGTTVSPTYATLTMAFLELSLYQKVQETYGDVIVKYVRENWKRFLDDGHILWKKSFGPVEEFIDILNSLDEDIRFTFDTSEIGLPFLQLFVYKTPETVETDIYYKETDGHDYLPFKSNHPRHTLENIPFNLARNICALVDNPDQAHFRLQELRSWLLRGGYHHELIHHAIRDARNIDRNSLLSKTVRDEKETLPFIITHNPRNPHVYNEIVQSFNFLKSTDHYHGVLSKIRLIKSERQPKNLYRHLVHSNVIKKPFSPGSKKCGNSRCGTCKFLLECSSVQFQEANTVFNLSYQFDCTSGGLIYKITCIGCDEYYIGLTVHLRNRVNKHNYDLRHLEHRKMKVHKHLYDCIDDNVENPFEEPCYTIVPFFKVFNPTPARLQATEDYFVRKFKPSLNIRKVRGS